MENTLQTFNTTVQKFGASVDGVDLAGVTTDLQKLLVDVRAKVDAVPVEELSEDGQKMLESLSTTSRQMQTLVDALQTSPLLNADAVGAIIGDFQATAQNFRVLSENLRQYPSQLLLGEPPKRSTFDPTGRPRR
jgi:hypothetical protein